MIDFKKKLLRFFPLTFDEITPARETEISQYADKPTGFHGKNPGIVALGRDYLVCIRCANYVYKGRNVHHRVLTAGDHFMTVNRFVLIDHEFRLICTLPNLDNVFDYIEDIKLFTFNNIIMGIGSFTHPERDDDAVSIALLTIDADFSGGHIQFLASPFNLHREKNWSPFVYKNELHFIYSFDPLIVLRYDPKTEAVSFADYRSSRYTKADLEFLVGGSSAGLVVPGGFLFAAHRRRVTLPRLDLAYVTRFYRLETASMTLKAGQFFSIGPAAIQFVNGFVQSESDIVLSYGQVDRSARLCRVPAERLAPSLAE